MADEPLKLTPVGTYTGTVKDASIGFGRSTGMGFIKLKLEIDDAVPPGYQNSVWCHVSGVELATHPDWYKQIGFPMEPTEENVKVLVDKRYVFRVNHELYRGTLYVSVRLKQLSP